MGSYSFCNAVLWPEFLLVDLWGFFFSDLGLGTKTKSFENDQFTFRAFSSSFFNISRKTLKLISKANQQSILNLKRSGLSALSCFTMTRES